MSSTNRSNARNTHISDYYITPVAQIALFLDQLFVDYPKVGYFSSILDPCAGGDADNPMSYPKALAEFGITHVKTMDIRDDSPAEIKGNYLTTDIEPQQLIITNPPFNMAEQIIKKALSDTVDGGFVVMLLRLNFLGGKTRQETFWSEVGMPEAVYLHPKRMSFTNDNKTDSIEYAHFVWIKGKGNPAAALRFVGME